MNYGKCVYSNKKFIRPSSEAGGCALQGALKYKSKVSFRMGNTTANAKSVLSVLGACVKSGDEIEFCLRRAG